VILLRLALLAAVTLALATIGPMRAEARAMFRVLRPAFGRARQ
jgi:hypothetical protein